MPYVQRNYVGEITGYFANPQPGLAKEFLTDAHPDLLAYIAAHPAPPIPQPLNAEQIGQLQKNETQRETETRELQALILKFLKEWAELEIAFSALFHAIVNPNQQGSKVPYAIYYALGGFDARIGVVNSAMAQLIEENKPLKALEDAWKKIIVEAKSVKNVRNQVAHGSILTIVTKGRQITRLTAPAFDVNNIWRKLAKGPEVGLSVKQLTEHLACLPLLSQAFDAVNRLISDYREFGVGLLPERLASLKLARSHLGTPRSKPRTPKAPAPPPRPSPAKRERKTQQKALVQKAARAASKRK